MSETEGEVCLLGLNQAPIELLASGSHPKQPSTYVFTGISGTGVKAALHRLRLYLSEPVTIISIDDYLWRAFCEDARLDPVIRKQTDLEERDIADSSSPNWWRFLKLPIDRVRYYWQAGAKRAIREVNDLTEGVAFVTFHACFQGDDYRWRLSPVDVELLRALRPVAFFALVDDCFDIHCRRQDDLRAERQSCSRIEDPWHRLEKLTHITVSRLSDLLLWREEEIMFTDVFAATCKVPCHLFSVKHPIATLAKLIQDPATSFYFSHPITAIRIIPGFPKVVELEQIQEVAREMRGQLPLVEPTTIDEFRFRRIEGSSDFLPVLEPRWPLLGSPEDLLYVPIADHDSSSESIFSVKNVEYLGVAAELQEICAGHGPGEIRKSILTAVRQLKDTIAGDITWRDHHLVDQTRRLIVFRPSYNGRKSGGVQREVRYFAKLARTGAVVRPSVVYHPDSDEEALARTIAKDLVARWKADPEIGVSLARIGPVDRDAELVKDLAKELQFARDIDGLPGKVLAQLERYYSIEPEIIDPEPMGIGRTLDGIDRAEQVRVRALSRAADKIADLKYFEPLFVDPQVPVFQAESQEALRAWVQEQSVELTNVQVANTKGDLP